MVAVGKLFRSEARSQDLENPYFPQLEILLQNKYLLSASVCRAL